MRRLLAALLLSFLLGSFLGAFAAYAVATNTDTSDRVSVYLESARGGGDPPGRDDDVK